MKFSLHTPPPGLQVHVHYFWTAEVTPTLDGQLPIHTMVDDSSGLIFLHSNQSQPLLNDGHPVPEAMLYGQTTAPSSNTCHSPFQATGVLFRPHAIRELFGLDASEVTDRMVDLGDLGLGSLSEQVREHSGKASRQLELLTQFLTDRAARVKQEDALVKGCLEQLQASGGLLTVRELQQASGLSERQLERRFRAVVGVTPRHCVKVTRFQQAVRLLRTGQADKLSDLAYDLHYADQSHFIRHCKALSGLSPSQLQERLQEALVNLIV